MNKTKILFVDRTPFAGGAQLRLAEDIKWLDRKKIEPFLLIDKASKFEQIYKDSDVKIFKIPFSRLNLLHPIAIPRLLRAVKAFSELIHKLEPDIVMANTTRALLVAALASKIHRSDFKLISYIRDFDYPKWVFQLIGDEVDKYIFVSKSIKDYYKLAGEVIYLGSDFNPIPKKTSKMFSIGYLGRLVDWKGARELIAAYTKLNEKNTQLLLWGTGEGQAGSVENSVKKLATKKVIFKGFTARPAEAYSQMDCYVLPSQKAEPFATTLVEAALSQLPIVATDTGGTREFIKNGKNGLLVKPGDTNQLSQALLRLLKEPELRKNLANNAFKDAQKFTQSAFMKVFEKVLLT